jgi:sugar phosphate isomerase/epimerase
MKKGVILESFKTNTLEALKYASELGLDGIQFYGVNGELDCDKLSCEERLVFKQALNDYKLVVAAVCADMGGHGFKYDDEERALKTMRVMDLAKEFDCNVVTTHVGVIDSETKANIAKAMKRIGEYGERIGVKLALETGAEKCEVLKEFLDTLNSENIGVNFDPANLVMVTDDDPIKGVYLLKDYIFHTHVKDGIMKKKTDPKRIYNYFADGGIEDIRLDEYFIETPLGEGDVDIKAWIQALKDVGYNGFLTIEREVGNSPIDDIKKAVDFINRISSSLITKKHLR